MKPDATTGDGPRRHRKPVSLSRWRNARPFMYSTRETERKLEVDPSPVLTTEGFCLKSPPVIFEEIHHLRAVLCLICMEAIGGTAARMIAVIDPRLKSVFPWGIPCRGYLVHADHELPEAIEMIQLAHLTEYPNCSCNNQPMNRGTLIGNHNFAGGYLR